MGDKNYEKAYKEVKDAFSLLVKNKDYIRALFTPDNEYAGTLPWFTDFEENGGIEKLLEDVKDINDKFEHWGRYLEILVGNKEGYDPDSPKFWKREGRTK